MGKRNALYRKAKYLLQQDGLSEDQATKYAYAAVVKSGEGNN